MVVQVNDMDMVASELRHFNWVVYQNYHNGEDKFWMVRTAYFNDVDLTDSRVQTRVNLNLIKPIPLTEEILLKCGLDLIGTSYFIKQLTCIYFSKPYVEATQLLVKSNSGDKLTSVMYLHQLQNLYFELTGQELNVKL